MQPHVCNWNSAAVPATPGSERAREPESQGERGEHQDASRNTDREISAFLQKHSTNRALNYCAVSHFDQVLQLEFNNWHLSQCVTVPKMLNDTDTDTFFRYQIFSIPIPILFSVPNFPIPVPRLFSDTKFYRYRFRDFFPVPFFSDTGSVKYN